eukprot:TRINITY_DN23982_c0_g1_i1.p1 TRINITY_DN23982_c0_g1~~TRINITY_DN23982_c0_g1_i1.p1  ORF type:complete len:2410 (-),score=451.28 TRINITY_DN23982_c0_g1_i1:125-6652(-)
MAISQGQRKQMKKQAKRWGKPALDEPKTMVVDIRKEEALRKLEAQMHDEAPFHFPETSALSEIPLDILPTAPMHPALPSGLDETASVASGTTGRTLRFEEPGFSLDAESIADTSVQPVVQDPRRAALDPLFSAEPWDVLLSDSAYVRLQQASKPQQQDVLKVLKRLASGCWRPEHSELLGTHGPLKLKRAQCGELDVLWGVDMEFSRERKVFVEVLQIWDISSKSETEKASATVLHEWRQSRRSFQGLQGALQRQKLPKDPEGPRLPRVVAQADLQDSDVFSVRKFFALDGQMLSSLIYDEGNRQGTTSASEQFTLRISKQEAAVVEKNGPMIVIGRSGSGKTLCCVYRIFFQYSEYWKRSRAAGGAPLIPDREGLSHLNQVFVTHSVSLANKVLEYFSNLQQSAQQPMGADKKTLPGGSLVEQTRLPDNIKSFRAFPIFVTFRKFLVMIDGSCRVPFFPRRHTGAVHPEKVDMAESPEALDPISALREQKRAAQRAQALGRGGSSSHSSTSVMTEVDYDLFKTKFWPKLCQKVPSGCDASLVWREIQTFIKGSYKVLDTEKGYLEIGEYREMAKKCSPGFEEHRPQIYDAFETYEKLRKEWKCFDRMDACFHVIRQLRQEPYTGPPIHGAAIDEVQDLAQLELAIFFMVMKRPYEELFITGDTSQTVSRAVDFRFCDLRSLFHYFGVPPPEIDQLIINYRSHQKILALTHSGVVRPLELAFPHAVDVLQPDLGHRDGPKPIVVTDVLLEDLAQHLFNLDGSSTGIAFGASQSILVRTEASKRCLPDELSKALVLTVEQSKGLEFDDCIMVNFFQDSIYKEWQVMRNFQVEDLLGSKTEQEIELRKKRPHFERYRHTLLCSELKHLYTAMTRTKNVLLIIEQDSEQAQHIFGLWNAMGLVSFGLLAEENMEAISQLLQRAGSSKGTESWRAMGFNLLHKQLFEQAKSSFQRAGDEAMVSQCEAYLVAQQAARMMTESEAEGMTLYLKAADLFQAADAKREQAECLLLGNKPFEAARIFETLGDECKTDAARAYAQARKYQRAGELYEESRHYREALENFVLADLMEEVKRLVLKAHMEKVLDGDECFRYLQHTESHDVAAELFFRDGAFQRAASCFQSAGMLEREAECYEKLQLPLKAADCLSSSNEPEHLRRASELYINLKEDVKAAACYKSLLKIDESGDRPQMLSICASLYDKLGYLAQAAEFWEQLGDLGDENALRRAVSGFEAGRCFRDSGHVLEKLSRTCESSSILTWLGASRPDQKKDDLLKLAAEKYEQAKCFEDALRVLEKLEHWEACAKMAAALNDQTLAAKFYHSSGNLKCEAECLVKAGEFQAAYSLMQQPDFPEAEPQMEIACLAGLGKHDEAARRQMAVLPESADDNRQKLAFKAFDLAKRDKNRWKQFLADFQSELPDAESAFMLFAELGDVKEMSEHLIKNQQPLAAVAAASVLGEPEMALEMLKQCPNEDHVKLSLDILLHAIEQDLGPEKFKSLQHFCKELQTQITADRECFHLEQLRLHYVSAVLHRLEKPGATVRKNSKEVLQLFVSYTNFSKVSEDTMSQAFCFRIQEELCLVGKLNHKDLKATVETAQRCSGQLSNGQKINDWLQEGFLLHSELHDHLFKHLEACCRATKRPAFPTASSNIVLVPKCHRLCQKTNASFLEPVLAFPGVMLLKDVKTAMQENLAERHIDLLIKLSDAASNDNNMDFFISFALPDLWLKACNENSVTSREVRLREGFDSSLIDCARTWATKEKLGDNRVADSMLEQLSEDVRKQLLETAHEMWASALKSNEAGLVCKTKEEFKKASEQLQETIRDAVRLYMMHAKSLGRAPRTEIIIKKVAELVLQDLKELRPICPKHIETDNCEGKSSCPLDHPDVPCTTNPWILLSLDPGSKHKDLAGIGFQGWIDIVSRCYTECTRGCRRTPEECRWKHPIREVAQELRKRSRDTKSFYDNKVQQHTKAAAVFINKQGEGSRTIPHGFGYLFFEDAELTRNVRLVALLCLSLLKGAPCHVGFRSFKGVLLRMCRSIYRFPEQHVAQIVREALDQLRLTDLRELSYEITWEVEGYPDGNNFSRRCLLSELLGKKAAGQERQSQGAAQRSGPAGSAAASFYPPSKLNPDAKDFKPSFKPSAILQRPQPNKWADGNASSMLFKPAQSQLGWRPTLPKPSESPTSG